MSYLKSFILFAGFFILFPLHSASAGDVDEVQEMLRQHADPNGGVGSLYLAVTSNEQIKELNRAISFGNVDDVREMLRQRVDPNGGEFTPLYFAFISDHIPSAIRREIVSLLVGFGADINAGVGLSGDPLFHQIIVLHGIDLDQGPDLIERIKLLIEFDADVNITDEIGRTPLDMAYSFLESPNLEMAVQVLENAGAVESEEWGSFRQ